MHGALSLLVYALPLNVTVQAFVSSWVSENPQVNPFCWYAVAHSASITRTIKEHVNLMVVPFPKLIFGPTPSVIPSDLEASLKS